MEPVCIAPGMKETHKGKAGVQPPGKEIITKEYAGVQSLAVKPTSVQSPAVVIAVVEVPGYAEMVGSKKGFLLK